MYYIISFLSGMSVMILELAGINVISSYINNSNLVCTSIIGIIMISLSIGYYLGGKLSKYRPSGSKLSFYIFISVIYIFLLTLFQLPIIKYICILEIPHIIKSLSLSAILYAIPSIILGIVSPYIIQVAINEEKRYKKAGSISGNFYAISTIGSILGTFLSGFFLIIKYSINTTYILTCFILTICVFLCNFSSLKNYLISKYLEVIQKIHNKQNNKKYE